MDVVAHQHRDVPFLRGILHVVSCPIVLVAGLLLARLAPDMRTASALLLMACGYAGIFGASALYHRGRWSPQRRRLMRRIDHSMIYIGMATTYTAVWLIALDGWLPDAVLLYCWIGAFVGVISKVWYLDASPTRAWLPYLGVGLMGLVVVPGMWQTVGPTGVGLMLAGGLVIAVASVAFAIGRPNPIPGWMGHHEVFHAGTVIGAALQIGGLAHFALS